MKYLIKKPDTFLDALNDDISSILHRNFDSLFPEYIFNKETQGMVMPVDIKEFEDSFVVKVELPGIKKDDITVDINKTSVKVDAHKESEKEESDKKKRYHKSEFKYGQYSRTLYFPQDINVKESKAELQNGLLKINLPKMQRDENETSKLEIKEK